MHANWIIYKKEIIQSDQQSFLRGHDRKLIVYETLFVVICRITLDCTYNKILQQFSQILKLTIKQWARNEISAHTFWSKRLFSKCCLSMESLRASILCCWYHTFVLFPDLHPQKSVTWPSQSLSVDPMFTLPVCPSVVAASSTARCWCSRQLRTCKRNHHKVSSEGEFVATLPSASPLLGLVNALRREMCLSLTELHLFMSG